MIKELMDFD